MELPSCEELDFWNIPKVVNWLKLNDLGHLEHIFRANYIKGSKLARLMRDPLFTERQLNLDPDDHDSLKSLLRNVNEESRQLDQCAGYSDDDDDPYTMESLYEISQSAPSGGEGMNRRNVPPPPPPNESEEEGNYSDPRHSDDSDSQEAQVLPPRRPPKMHKPEPPSAPSYPRTPVNQRRAAPVPPRNGPPVEQSSDSEENEYSSPGARDPQRQVFFPPHQQEDEGDIEENYIQPDPEIPAGRAPQRGLQRGPQPAPLPMDAEEEEEEDLGEYCEAMEGAEPQEDYEVPADAHKSSSRHKSSAAPPEPGPPLPVRPNQASSVPQVSLPAAPCREGGSSRFASLKNPFNIFRGKKKVPAVSASPPVEPERDQDPQPPTPARPGKGKGGAPSQPLPPPPGPAPARPHEHKERGTRKESTGRGYVADPLPDLDSPPPLPPGRRPDIPRPDPSKTSSEGSDSGIQVNRGKEGSATNSPCGSGSGTFQKRPLPNLPTDDEPAHPDWHSPNQLSPSDALLLPGQREEVLKAQERLNKPIKSPLEKSNAGSKLFFSANPELPKRPGRKSNAKKPNISPSSKMSPKMTRREPSPVPSESDSDSDMPCSPRGHTKPPAVSRHAAPVPSFTASKPGKLPGKPGPAPSQKSTPSWVKHSPREEDGKDDLDNPTSSGPSWARKLPQAGGPSVKKVPSFEKSAPRRDDDDDGEPTKPTPSWIKQHGQETRPAGKTTPAWRRNSSTDQDEAAMPTRPYKDSSTTAPKPIGSGSLKPSHAAAAAPCITPGWKKKPNVATPPTSNSVTNGVGSKVSSVKAAADRMEGMSIGAGGREGSRFAKDPVRNHRPTDSVDATVREVPIESEPWFTTGTRTQAQAHLKHMRDGSFLVRKSSKPNPKNPGDDPTPYALSIQYQGIIKHLHIRQRVKDNLYALGNPKQGEPATKTVADLIEHHRENIIHLIGDNGGYTRLTDYPRI